MVVVREVDHWLELAGEEADSPLDALVSSDTLYSQLMFTDREFGDMTTWLTLEEAANYLKMGKSTIYKLARGFNGPIGAIPGRTGGGYGLPVGGKGRLGGFNGRFGGFPRRIGQRHHSWAAGHF